MFAHLFFLFALFFWLLIFLLTRYSFLDVEVRRHASGAHLVQPERAGSAAGGVGGSRDAGGGAPRPRGAVLEWLSALEELEELDLSWCSLDAPPDSLFCLSRLTSLALAHNEIRALPPRLNALSNLRALDVQCNSALGALPVEIGALHALQSLDVSHCALRALPREIALLGALTSLSANGNIIESIPADIAAMTSLVRLSAAQVRSSFLLFASPILLFAHLFFCLLSILLLLRMRSSMSRSLISARRGASGPSRALTSAGTAFARADSAAFRTSACVVAGRARLPTVVCICLLAHCAARPLVSRARFLRLALYCSSPFFSLSSLFRSLLSLSLSRPPASHTCTRALSLPPPQRHPPTSAPRS